jgi:hypothetical protein
LDNQIKNVGKTHDFEIKNVFLRCLDPHGAKPTCNFMMLEKEFKLNLNNFQK